MWQLTNFKENGLEGAPKVLVVASRYWVYWTSISQLERKVPCVES